METKYEETLFYQINSCSRYFQAFFEQIIGETVRQVGTEISAIEYLALGIIIDTDNCCQRDLARIILKDRGSAGKIASSLEKKRCIKVELKTKNNRSVKILTATKEGLDTYQKILKAIYPLVEKIESEISKQVITNTIETLKHIKNVVGNVLESNI